MGKPKRSRPTDLEGIEEWMGQFFSNIDDSDQFRIDLFETSSCYIVEAEVPSFISFDMIKIKVKNDCLYLTLDGLENREDFQDVLERIVILPFPLENKEIKAQVYNGMLEVKICKEKCCNRESCEIYINPDFTA
ncbi:Hsp20/alpha crystallin family protein [Metabacillus arenae]|uniref:Hsp20 family protein n=1 Tax=Metabacillus arenae TaxID=2771434 RepID=A0A926RWN7_9BACI|nr:Hsp20 family protein [Metabacillus arenae]MBD1379337.1 Hsp20 family protein [Metabacillus arenae]